MVNKAILIGNVGKDPEGGKGGVVRFSIATTKKGKKKDGTPFENTVWHNVVAFGRLAEIIMQYVFKGQKIYIEGEIDNSINEKPDGTKTFYSSIIARDMQMLSHKKDGERDHLKVENKAFGKELDNDIPF